VPLIPKCSLLEQVNEENQGELANPGSPGNQQVVVALAPWWW